MGSCLSSNTYYYDNSDYNTRINREYNTYLNSSYHAYFYGNGNNQQFPTDDEVLRKRAEMYASKIERERIRNAANELRHSSKYELENSSRRDILSGKLLKIQQVCNCAKSHILYWSANHQDNW